MDEVNHGNATGSADADFNTPLKRTFYETGMMLTSSAFKDEQNYHRTRMNRHQYWLHGYGTIAGMAVSLSHIPPSPEVTETVRILVHPGLGIDRLGREVLVDQTYCIDLNEWLASKDRDYLESFYDDSKQQLSLKITVSYKDCLTGYQPVLARKLNASTDAVQPERKQDSIDLQLSPYKTGDEHTDRVWPLHQQLEKQESLKKLLTDHEFSLYKNENNADKKKQLEQRARLLHAYQQDESQHLLNIQEMAQIFLSQITLKNITDLENVNPDPEFIDVNSLNRPFVNSRL